MIAGKSFWDNPEKTTVILKERTLLSTKVRDFNDLYRDLEDSEILLNLAMEESDAEALAEVVRQLSQIEKRIQDLSLSLMLDGEDDLNNAIVSITAGAGGTEAQDWSEMLFRMYARWIEQKNFKMEIVDY